MRWFPRRERPSASTSKRPIAEGGRGECAPPRHDRAALRPTKHFNSIAARPNHAFRRAAFCRALPGRNREGRLHYELPSFPAAFLHPPLAILPNHFDKLRRARTPRSDAPRCAYPFVPADAFPLTAGLFPSVRPPLSRAGPHPARTGAAPAYAPMSRNARAMAFTLAIGVSVGSSQPGMNMARRPAAWRARSSIAS